MKVVLLKSRWGSGGGLEKYANRIAQAFLKKGAELTILTTDNILLLQVQVQVQVHAIKPLPWPGFLRLEQFDRFTQNWLKNNRVDLVFGLDRNRFQTHIRAGNGVHAAYLKTRSPFCKLNPLHRTILSIEKSGFENPVLQKLFTNSYMVRNEILEHYKTDPKKIEVVHNGVEWQDMEKDWKNFQNRDVYQFLFIGNGFARKGLDALLVGLSRLKNRNFHLFVIGKDKKSDCYKREAKQLGLESKVEFVGLTSEIRKYYQMSDCLVIPSFYDPFANVTVEALAMGLFVLSSRSNGGHEILTKQNGAIIENLQDPDAMIEALELAMKQPKTEKSAFTIRESVKHLDFSLQLEKLLISNAR